MTNDLGHRASSPYRRGAADGARVERDDPIAMIRLATMAAAFQAMSASLIAALLLAGAAAARFATLAIVARLQPVARWIADHEACACPHL